jgi:hypothetical protein
MGSFPVSPWFIRRGSQSQIDVFHCRYLTFETPFSYCNCDDDDDNNNNNNNNNNNTKDIVFLNYAYQLTNQLTI